MSAIADIFENPGFLGALFATPNFNAAADALQLDIGKVRDAYLDILKVSQEATTALRYQIYYPCKTQDNHNVPLVEACMPQQEEGSKCQRATSQKAMTSPNVCLLACFMSHCRQQPYPFLALHMHYCPWRKPNYNLAWGWKSGSTSCNLNGPMTPLAHFVHSLTGLPYLTTVQLLNFWDDLQHLLQSWTLILTM